MLLEDRWYVFGCDRHRYKLHLARVTVMQSLMEALFYSKKLSNIDDLKLLHLKGENAQIQF